MMTIRILVAALMATIGLTSSIVDVSYDQKAKDFYEEVQTNMNEMFDEEKIEELKEEGIIIEDVSVSYEPNEHYDNAYTFSAGIVMNGITIREIEVMDMEDDTELEYYGLINNELLTPEMAEYYRNLLRLN